MFKQHVVYGVCESFSTGSGYDHTADLYDTDRECGIERTSDAGQLDIDTHTRRNNLYRERYELYGHGSGGQYDIHLHGNQQQWLHLAVIRQCGDQCSTGRSGIGRGR